MSNSRYSSFKEFWPFYVAEHSKPGTRWMHLIGTVMGGVVMIYFIIYGPWWLFPLGLIPGYGAAWFAHFVIEKNKPATFRYPLWSFMGDYKMIAMMVTGRIDKEAQAAKGKNEL